MKEMKMITNLAHAEADRQILNMIDRFTKKIISNAPQGLFMTEVLMKNQESTGVVTEETEVDLTEDVENSEAATEDAEISQCAAEVAETSHLEANVVEDAENSEVASEAISEEITMMIITRIKILSVTTNKLPIIVTR